MSFAFKNRVVKRVEKSAETPESSKAGKGEELKEPPISSQHNISVAIKDRKGVDERVESPDGSTVAVERVEESKLSFPFSAKAVILEGITDSTLLLLPTETSVLVQKCSRMKLVAAAQQIRIHDSRDLTLYVHFGSAVIIGSEGCTGIKLAPYLLSTSQEHLAKDPLGRYFTADARSRCATVMDFDCVTGKSPNWSLLGEGEFEEFTL